MKYDNICTYFISFCEDWIKYVNFLSQSMTFNQCLTTVSIMADSPKEAETKSKGEAEILVWEARGWQADWRGKRVKVVEH